MIALLLVVVIDLIGFGIIIPLLPFYAETYGASPQKVTMLMVIFSFCQFIAAPMWGYLSDKYSKKLLLSGLYFFRAISIMLFIFLPPSNISAIAFGVTFGLLWLATVPATNGIVAQVFGAKNLSMLFGIVFLNHQIGSFLGAYLGGVFYDMFGNYDYAWYLAIVLSFVATLLHLPIDEKPIKEEATI